MPDTNNQPIQKIIIHNTYIRISDVVNLTEIKNKTKNGLIDQTFILTGQIPVEDMCLCKIIALTDVVYDNEVVVKQGESIRFYNSLPVVEEKNDRISRGKTDFSIVIGPRYFVVLDMRPASTFGKDFDSSLLQDFSAAAFIDRSEMDKSFERKNMESESITD